ncbi:glycoside hydrolase family 3 C-terminal domain-containing protein [Franconibacter helveticus]|uniref:beta-glucosidase family protein n=1 Tax=Franconibacter helveticus TaxID=357240 RepID=UPI00290DD9B4|nr:glycoside hydrolase family 3 C-terminal domain-containing protein [Franconibacter helveticus]MDU6923778.1 glycoside hydrolase family 3 C-terminal domain-containing protein [Franconibacter helveticus]
MFSSSIPLNTEEKARLTAGGGMWSTHPVPHTALGSVMLSDGPMGITGGRVDERDVALLSPCGLALGASWDRHLATRVGRVIGEEALRTGIQALLAPNLNLMRSPMAGRAFELYGEDPRHIAAMGAAWIEGVQSQGVGCVAKHLVCNDSETDRRTMNVVVDEATLREVYFWPFEVAASRGVWGMLTAYNRVNGVYCAEQQQVVSQWLKQGLAWDGLVMSDWFGTQNGPASFRAGLDLEMPGPARHMGENLLPALTASEADERRLDDAVDRLARFAQRCASPRAWDASPQAQRQRREVLEAAAAAGFVLLRNREQLLPLAPAHGRRVAVIGPNAAQPCFQGGTFARVALMPDLVSPLDALRQRLAREGATVTYAQGVESDYRIPPLTALPLFAASGEPGLDVTYALPGRGALHHERRHASSLIWFREMPGVGDMPGLQEQAVVTVTTRFSAPETGVYRFWLGGTGEVSLRINGQCVGRFNGEAVDGDIMGKLMQAPAATVEITLAQGEAVAFELTMQLCASIAHGIWFGCRPPQPHDLLAQAVACAREADEAIIIIGETADAGLESIDRDTTALPQRQAALIRAVCAANPRTLVVLNVAHPVDTLELDDAAALMIAWYPGQEFGPALAAVVTGDKEPGGRLPVTFAQKVSDYPVQSLKPDHEGNLYYHERQFVGYRAFAARNLPVAWAFGYGLGYAEIALCSAQLLGGDLHALTLEVVLENRSMRAGKAVVQVYLRAPAGDEAQEPLRLADFAASETGAQERQVIRLPLAASLFQRWSAKKQAWVTVAGSYQLMTGFASNAIEAVHEIYLDEHGGITLLSSR